MKLRNTAANHTSLREPDEYTESRKHMERKTLMKTAVILETDHLSIPVSDLLNPKEMKLVGIGNSHPETWNVFANAETGELKEEIEGMPVMPIDLAVSLQPDVIVIAAADPEKSHALQYMAIRAGFLNDIIFINDIYTQFTVKGAAIRRLTRRLTDLGISGNIAELGCYQGDLSWQLNVLMPERKLYLFDTFEGFDARDIAREQELSCSESSPASLRMSRRNPCWHACRSRSRSLSKRLVPGNRL